MKIVKTAGPDELGNFEGHCYDGTGWIDCDFWEHCQGNSRCMLFGGKDGVPKVASHALKCCDKVYGINYSGEA